MLVDFNRERDSVGRLRSRIVLVDLGEGIVLVDFNRERDSVGRLRE